MKAILILSTSAALLAMATPALSTDALNWTPATYAELETTVMGSANVTNEPVISITIGPKKFKSEINKGYAEYLHFMRTPFNLKGAPDNIKEAFIRQEYFRDQTSPSGSKADGTHKNANYRSAQKAFVIHCTDSTLANNGFSRFEFNEKKGLALYFEEGTLDYSKLKMSKQNKGSAGASLIQAVCDGKYIYAPKKKNETAG